MCCAGGAEWEATSHQDPWTKVRTREVNHPEMDPFMALFQIGQFMSISNEFSQIRKVTTWIIYKLWPIIYMYIHVVYIRTSPHILYYSYTQVIWAYGRIPSHLQRFHTEPTNLVFGKSPDRWFVQCLCCGSLSHEPSCSGWLHWPSLRHTV